MSFLKTFLSGEEGLFKPETLTPMQKLTLRYVVVGLIYYGFVIIEGMLMRLFEVNPLPFISQPQFYAILTAHPLVGIFGSTYLIVFGAFTFLVPFLMKKPLWSMKLGNWTFILITAGTFIFWFAGFVSHYAPLYTLYWPLPADFSQFSVWGGTFFIVGIALVMVGTALFIINIFKTIVYTPEGMEKQPVNALLSSALGITGFMNLFRKNKKEHIVPLPVAAVARGSVDLALNTATGNCY
jgi:cytochrome c oxidase subunit 1